MLELVDFAKQGNASIEDAIAGIEKLTISSAKKGKENAGSKENIAAIQACLKQAQKRLAQPGEDVAQLSALCQSCLRALEQHKGSMKPVQFHTAAYSTIRLLVSAKAFIPAFEEAQRLHRALWKEHNLHTTMESAIYETAKLPALPTDVLNLAVGAILTMALCWAEGAARTSDQLSYVLNAAESSQSMLRLLPAPEATKHSQTLFKSMYRGSAKLLEAKNWENLQAACNTMVLAGGPTSAPLAFAAVAKLSPYAPDVYGIPMLINALLCPIARSNLNSAVGKTSESADVEILKAVVGTGNVLRKRISSLISDSSDPESILEAVGGRRAASQVATALDSAAALVGVGASRREHPDAFSGYGHSAAVGLVCAARLRAACALKEDVEVDWTSGTKAAQLVLGQSRSNGGIEALPPLQQQQLLSLQELTWLSSSMFNVGVELLSGCDTASSSSSSSRSFLVAGAVEVLAVSTAAASSALHLAAAKCSEKQDVSLQQIARDVAKRACALIGAIGKSGKGAAEKAVGAAADALAAICAANTSTQLAAAPLATIVTSVVRQQVQQHSSASESAGTKSKSKSAKRTTTKAACPSITATVLDHPLGVSEASIALIARTEISVWAAELSSSSCLPAIAEAAAGGASAAARHLLTSVYPAKTAPLDHVRTLLIMHNLKIEDLNAKDSCLNRAEAVLKPLVAKGGAGPARALSALVAAQKVLDQAQDLIQAAIDAQQASQKALQEQIKLNPSKVHADEVMKWPLGEEGKGAGAIFEHHAAEWGQVLNAAHQAVDQINTLLEDENDFLEEFAMEEGVALGAAVKELAGLVGLHGSLEVEAAALAASATLSEKINSTSLQSFGALQHCILPGWHAAAADPAALETAAKELAVSSNGRDDAIVLRRADLYMQAALGYAGSGDSVPALHCAGEAHRLLSSVVRETSTAADGRAGGRVVFSPENTTSSMDTSSVGTWELSQAYCRCLFMVGRLFDSSGMAEEAVCAIKEGYRTAEALGSKLLSAAFLSQLTSIWCRGGHSTAASSTAESAQSLLDASLESTVASVAGQWVAAHVDCVQARLASSSGETTQALLLCHQALDSCEAATHQAAKAECSSLLRPHLDALLATVHLTRVQCLQAEGRPVKEVAAATGEALQLFHVGACATFGAPEKAELFLILAEAAEIAFTRSERLVAARLWGPDLFSTEDANSGAASGRSRAPAASKKSHSASAEVATNALDWAGNASLWSAFAISRGSPHVHRVAAAKLAPACAAAGFSHLAALLLHLGSGTTLRLQHKLVLHARERNAQRRQLNGLSGSCNIDEDTPHVAAAETLSDALEWGLVESVLCHSNQAINKNDQALTSKVTTERGGSSRRTTTAAKKASAAPATGASRPPSPACIHDALTALNFQAEKTLQKWLSALPSGTTVCTIASRRINISSSSSSSSSRQLYQDCLVISQLAPGAVSPVIVDIPVQEYLTESSLHPIRALSLDNDEAEEEDTDGVSSLSSRATPQCMKEESSDGSNCGALVSVVSEMANVLERSTRSMKEMATETRDQQREWWRARVDLDDSLAALLRHLGSNCLGPWKCLLIGPPEAPEAALELKHRANEAANEIAAKAVGEACEVPPGMVEMLGAVLHCADSMSAVELRQVATTLCMALQSSTTSKTFSREAVASAAKIITQAAAAGGKREAPHKQQTAAEKAPPKTGKKQPAVDFAAPLTTVKEGAGPRKVTFFQEAEEESSPPQTLRRAVPAALLNDADVAFPGGGSNLCARFEALDVAGERPPAATPGAFPARTPGAATLRATKHKSRLAMMQMSTPGPKTARKPMRTPAPIFETDDVASKAPPTAAAPSRIAATAPRAPRPLQTPAAAKTMPARDRPARQATPSLSGGPVVAIFSPELQSLPWESIPGLIGQRIYRLPALPCAAAALSATTAATATSPSSHPVHATVDLSSTYYVINPSGDLQSTQDTFETWFQGLTGWSGRAGSPPTAPELTSALQSKQLFVYCGHGGGEQYLPAARLRGMPRCAAALLMGCSSGRLRGTSSSGGGRSKSTTLQYTYYEPTGIVLAYLLAGCPAAVATLWDVTDRDIDRYAQAMLTRWLSGCDTCLEFDGNARREGQGEDERELCGRSTSAGDVAMAAALARDACKLPSLIGAAAVCYGLPTRVVVGRSASAPKMNRK